ncbi:MAG: radical SAM protein [bacterium]
MPEKKGGNSSKSAGAGESLVVTETYPSIIGEGTAAGLPGVIVRLTGCNLRCTYCDTRYAYEGGKRTGLSELVKKIERHRLRRVLVTGGEPLLQTPAVCGLLQTLIENGHQTMIETNGTQDIKSVPQQTLIIMDMKTPGSGNTSLTAVDNLDWLKPTDNIKFVLTGRADYTWSRNINKRKKLDQRFRVIFSPAYGMLEPSELAGWILEDKLNVRLGLQLHKYMKVR